MGKLVNVLGVNAFGLVKELNEDYAGTIGALKDLGFTAFEPNLLAIDESPVLQKRTEELMALIGDKVGMNRVLTLTQAKTVIPMIREAGLAVEICHLFHVIMLPDALVEMVPGVIALSKELGIKNFVVSFMTGDKESADRYIDAINRAIELLDKEGIRIAYHNHDMEHKLIEGTDETVLDYIFRRCDPRLMMEFDIGWCHYADCDPLAVIRRYHDRIIVLHLKDFKDKAFASIGEGDAPLQEAIALAKELGCPLLENGILIDQDESDMPMLEALKIGAENAFSYTA